jgi:hypothetical protein
MDCQLTIKDYLVREAKMLGRKDIVEGADGLKYVKYNKDIPRYTFKFDGKGETVFFNVPLWKEVSANTNYEVSRFGQVRRKGGIKTLSPSKGNYLRVALGHYKSIYSIHKLVVIAFIGYDIDQRRNEINHDDLNTQNNSLMNLYWVTRKENMEHYWDLSGRRFDYEDTLGKELNSKDGKIKVIGYDKKANKIKIEFEETGNQKYIQASSYIDSRPYDNYYWLISPTGEYRKSRSLNVLKESEGICGARFSEILRGDRKTYKGWSVIRSVGNIIK